MYIDKNPLLCL